MFVCGIVTTNYTILTRREVSEKIEHETPHPPCLKFEIILGNPKHKTTPDGYQQVNPSPNNNMI